MFNYNYKFPFTRMLRIRRNSFMRCLVSEYCVSVNDLIYPIFVTEGKNIYSSIQSMPGINFFSIDRLLIECSEIVNLGIKAIIVFPIINQNIKTFYCEESYNSKGLIQKTIFVLKKYYPDLGIITDVALDPYSLTGHDGIIDLRKGHIVNDFTVNILVKQAVSHARAGADVLAPSDMMDGRVGMIRKALETEGFYNTCILSYAVKYSSAYFSPFRFALGTNINLKSKSKSSYQMNCANYEESIKETNLDINEGADIIMIKPGVMCLDVVCRIKSLFKVPIFAYQVSGEYVMHVLAIKQGIFPKKDIVMESLLSFKRAGCNAIVTYFAKLAAYFLNN